MTPLTQQLEDKKKALLELEKNGIKKEGYACGEDFAYWEFPSENQKIFHYVLEAEIAILEQAIAEMQKRDKDEIELLKTIKKWICKVTPEMQLDNEILREVCPNIFYNCENRIEQLNQPKEEQ